MKATILIVPALAAVAALLPVWARRRLNRPHPQLAERDHGREARAEQRARRLLREAAGDGVAEMYEQLGFVSIEDDEYGYLLYPHRPIVAYDAETGEPLNEYCVRFPDGSDPDAGEWLPDADDVLAKWLALRFDEAHILGIANLHVLGRQLDPGMVRRDLEVARTWARRGDAETGATA